MEHIELRASRVFKVTKSVVFGDLTAAAATQSIDFDAALPADACIVGFGLDVTDLFVTAVAGNVGADLGVASGDTDVFLDGIAANMSAILGKKHSPAGVGPVGLVGAITPSILFTAAADDIGDATAGAMTADIYFIRVDAQA
ncbi:MAG: hypothetical protein ACE10O_00950 [Candidatus Acidiferrales bacterium]